MTCRSSLPWVSGEVGGTTVASVQPAMVTPGSGREDHDCSLQRDPISAALGWDMQENKVFLLLPSEGDPGCPELQRNGSFCFCSNTQ